MPASVYTYVSSGQLPPVLKELFLFTFCKNQPDIPHFYTNTNKSVYFGQASTLKASFEMKSTTEI